MKKLMILNLIALSFSLAIVAESHCDIMPDMRKPLPIEWAVRPNLEKSSELVKVGSNTGATQQIAIHNNTDLAIQGGIYVHDASKGGMLIILNPHESKMLSLAEFYWFEQKGLGYGPNTQPVNALMHSYAKKINLQVQNGTYQLQTLDLGMNTTIELAPSGENFIATVK